MKPNRNRPVTAGSAAEHAGAICRPSSRTAFGRVCRRLALGMICLVTAATAPAATVTWTGASGTDTNWSNPSNWDAGVPGASDDTVFSGAGVVFDTSIDNYVDGSFTINTLNYNEFGVSTYHNTYIADGQMLSVDTTAATNVVFVGSGTDLGNMDSLATISGPNASFSVTAGNGIFNVRQGGFSHYAGTASLDMSGLNTASIYARNLLVAGDGSNALDGNGGRPADRASGVLNLAQNTTLSIAGTTAVYGLPGITIGFINGNGGAGGHVSLGQVNTIYCDSGLAVGLNRAGSAANPCLLRFNPIFTNQSPTAVFRNLAGTGRQSNWFIGDASWLLASGNSTAGTVDLTGGSIDALVDQIVVGRTLPGGKGGPVTASTGVLTFDTGTLDVNTLTVGSMLADYCAMVAGTVNVNGTAQLKVNTSLALGSFRGADPAPTSTNGVSFAKLNINGGTVTVTGPITTTTSALNDMNDSEINLASGSLYVKGTVGPLYQLTLGSGATNTFDLGPSQNPLTPVCTVSNLSTAFPVYLTVAGSGLDLGTVQVIKYGSYSMVDASDFVLTMQGSAFGYITNNVANKSIDVVITNTATFSWNGRASGVNNGDWDIGITHNWKSGASEVVYSTSSNARFDDSLQGTTTVNITDVIEPPTTIFKNTTKNYTLTGSGAITGTGGLTKSGSGSVVIDNTGANAYGPTTINGGTIQLGSTADRLPVTGPVTLANAAGVTLDLNGQSQTIGSLTGGGASGGEIKLGAGQLTVKPTATTTYSGLISGGGSLTVSNDTALGFNLVLTRDNTFSGGTTIQNASVIVANSATGARTPLGTGPITIKGTAPNPGSSTAGLWLGNGAGTVGYVSQAFITNGQVVAFKNGLDMTFTNSIVGNAGLYVAAVGIAPNGARVTISGTNYFLGRVQIDSGELRVTTSQPWGNNPSPTAIVLGNQGQLELANNITLARAISHAGPSGGAYPAMGIVNVSGTNTLTGLITGLKGGSSWGYRSDAGKIIFRGDWTTSLSGMRNFWLQGAGEGEWYGNIAPSLTGNYVENIIKADTGTWTFWGTNFYAGCTVVSNGNLVINGTHVVVNTTSGSTDTNYYIGIAGTLRGVGTLTAPPIVYINAGGTLAPGTASGLGALTIAHTLTMSATTSTNLFRVSDTGVPANDQVRGLAQVNYAGTLKVVLAAGSLVGGEVFKLYDSAAYSATPFDAYDLPALPAALSWDTSHLTVDGTLRVAGTIGNKTIGVTSAGRAPDGNFRMGGGSVLTNWSYRVLASTTATNPLSDWTQIGGGMFTGGAFSFTDLDSTNYPTRFYRVVAP
jgi:autotransporter-associated beta strand protein